MMVVPINDLKRNFSLFQDELEAKALEVLRSGWYVLGKEVSAFEEEFALALGSKYCIGVDNGLNAIMLGCKAMSIGSGDEVIIQANTYIATVLGVTLNGATPVFIEPTSYYNLDPTQIVKSITTKTKAVLVTHLYGQASEMDRIIEICNEYGLILLEDCAQSHFATYDDKNTGTFGALSFFSFYPTKNLGAIGDAGCIVTDNQELAEKLKVLRNYGSKVRYQNIIEGHNARLDEIQAGFLRVKLQHMESICIEREQIANLYLLKMTNPLVILPKVAKNASHVWHLFVVQVQDRDGFRRFLQKNGVATDIHYPVPPHLSEAYSKLGYKEGSFPITERFSKTIVSLPIFNGMTQNEIDYVIEVVNKYGK